MKLKTELPRLDQLEVLPMCCRRTIPSEYIDQLGHMNVTRYFSLYGEAAMFMMSSIGMTPDYIRIDRGGNFVLRQVINYIAEVLEGDTVAVRGRILGRSEKRLHKIYFMVNETTGKVASTSEVLTCHADLEKRRSSPFPPAFVERIDEKLAAMRELDWDAPTAGIIEV